MKKLIILFVFCCIQNLHSQGEANYWFFGQNAGINFNSGSPVPISGFLNTIEGCSSFSDKKGNLLFYSDGITVWDKTGGIMQNGTNLFGNPSSTQSAIIVPHPTNDHLFYLFTVGANEYDRDGNISTPTKGLYCYTIDLTKNAGLGAVVGSPIDLSNGANSAWTEKITSVKGADCNSFWVISLVRNTFVTYKIDDKGLDTNPIISTVNFKSNDARGYLKVSPNGKYLASATYNDSGNLLLYSFNDATGEVTNNGIELISDIAKEGRPYGVEFSPLSSKLYCSTFDSSLNSVFQFDLSASNILASKTLVHYQTGFRGALQLAPNGKIYATVPIDYRTGTPYLDAINSPEKLGITCNYEEKVIDLSTVGLAMQGLPPFISSILLPIEITDGITNENLNKTTWNRCLGENYTLQSQNISGSAVTYKWFFNGTQIGTSPSISINNLNSSNSGTYFLEAETTDNCGFKILYKGEVTIEAHPYPTIKKPSKLVQCDDDGTMDGFTNIDLNTLLDTEVLNGQNPANFEVLYFSSLAEAQNNSNALAIPYTNKTSFGTEILYARIHNKNSIDCFEIESFELQVLEYPNPPKTISSYKICDSSNYGTETDGFEIFDLTSKNAEILNGLSATKFSISYFTDKALLNKISNPTSFTNTSKTTQTIYTQIINKNFPSCSLSTSFEIEVLEIPDILTSFTLKQCDDDGKNDGISTFNITEANNYLNKVNNSLTISYHLNLADASTKNNAINPINFSNSISTKLIARIENVNGCFKTSEINLLVSSTKFPLNYLKEVIQCDDDATADGKNLFDLNAISSDFIKLFPSGQNLNVSYFRNIADALSEQNPIDSSTPFLNEIPFEQTLIVRVESLDNGECFGLGSHLKLTVNERPEFELEPNAIYCKNLPPISKEIYNPKGIYTYQWKNDRGEIISNSPSASINEKGIYTVIATSEKGCESFPKTIQIEESVIASISLDEITVVDDSDNNSITISTTNLGVGDYEFALNSDGFYQDEPLFENVEAGIHTLYIRDKNNCGIASIEVPVIGYPRFFTPNNDGYNDTWKILGVSGKFYVNSNIYIFDRYGKLITKIDPSKNGWDGTFNGYFLPATDYWFSVELIDHLGNIKIRKGHFSLKR